MTARLRRMAVAILSPLLLTVFSNASACTCGGETFVEAVDRAPVVFRGIALSRTVPSPAVNLWRSGPPVHYEFRVLETWKGQEADTIGICTGLGGGDCGLCVEVGREYLVFASSVLDVRRSGCGYAASMCSLTRSIENSNHLLTLLDLYRTQPSLASDARDRALSDGVVDQFDGGSLSPADFAKALQLLASENEPAISRLSTIWDESDETMRREIVRTLHVRHTNEAEAERIVLAACADTSEEVRATGTELLGRWIDRSSGARSTLRHAMGDSIKIVRRAASSTLANRAGPWHAKLVTQGLHASDVRVRETAVLALSWGSFADLISYEDLEPLFASDDCETRAAAIQAVANVSIDSTRAEGLWQAALRDTCVEVRLQIPRTVGEMARAGTTSQTTLAKVLDDPVTEVAVRGAKQIESLPDKQAACRLLKLAARSETPEVREAAMTQTRGLDCRDDVLLSGLRDSDPRVSASALRETAREPYVSPTLKVASVDLLRSANMTRVALALEALARNYIAPAFLLEPLRELARSSDPEVAAVATQTLETTSVRARLR